MRSYICVVSLILLFIGRLLSQATTSAEMSSANYSIKHSSIVGAGGTVGSPSLLLQHQFSAPNMGRMEGGSFIIGSAVEVLAENKNPLPLDYTIEQNFPNPFNQSTTFRYNLPEKSDLFISVYSVLGQQLVVLVQGEQEAGRFTLRYAGLDGFGRPLPSGLYFCRMTTKGFDKTIKFAILR